MTQKLEGKKVRLDGLTNERRARLGTGYGQILAAGILEWYGSECCTSLVSNTKLDLFCIVEAVQWYLFLTT